MTSALINACMQHDSFIQIMHETNLSMKQLEHEMITIIRKLITDSNGAIEIDYQEPSLSSILSLEDSSDDSDGCSTVRSYTELDSIDPNMSSLSEEQKNFISLAMKGNSLFLTAPAGYGKSFAIDHVIKELRLLQMNHRVLLLLHLQVKLLRLLMDERFIHIWELVLPAYQ
jgi:hypothetical protein